MKRITKFEFFLIIALLISAVGIRLFFLHELNQKQLNIFSSNSDAYNIEMAVKGILENDSHNYHMHFIGSKVYPYLVSFFYFFKKDLFYIQVFQVLLSVLAMLLLYLTVCNLFNFSAGIISLFILCFYNMDVFYTSQLSYTYMGSFFLILSLFCTSKYIISNYCNKYFLIASFSIIILSLFLRQYWACFFVFTIYHFVKSDVSFKKNIYFFIVILSVGYMTFAITKPLFPFKENIGIHVYIGNNENANGIYNKLPNVRPNSKGHLIDGLLLANNPLINNSDTEYYFFVKALKFIKSQPYKFLKLLKNKLLLLFNSYEPANYLSIYFYEKYCLGIKLSFINYGLIFPFFLLGLTYSFLLKKDLFLYYLLMFFQILLNLIIFIADRYRFQMVPVMIIIAAYGIHALFENFKNKNTKGLFLSGIILILGFYISFQSISFINKNKDIVMAEKQQKHISEENTKRDKLLELYANLNDSIPLDKLFILGQHLKILNLSREAENIFYIALKIAKTDKMKSLILENIANLQEDMFEFEKALKSWMRLQNLDNESDIAKNRILVILRFLK